MAEKKYVYDALKILMEISKNAQEEAQENREFLSVKAWMLEYCSVRASTARRGGHTEAVMRLIEEDGMNIGYFCLNEDMSRQFNSLYNQRAENASDNFGNLEFCSSATNFRNKTLGRDLSNLDAMVFDNTFIMSKNLQDEVYNSLIPALFSETGRREFFLIFLQ